MDLFKVPSRIDMLWFFLRSIGIREISPPKHFQFVVRVRKKSPPIVKLTNFSTNKEDLLKLTAILAVGRSNTSILRFDVLESASYRLRSTLLYHLDRLAPSLVDQVEG